MLVLLEVAPVVKCWNKNDTIQKSVFCTVEHKRQDFILVFDAMQRKICIPLRRAQSTSWLASIENYRSRDTGMQHPCKFELPKWLMTALADTVISLGKIRYSKISFIWKNWPGTLLWWVGTSRTPCRLQRPALLRCDPSGGGSTFKEMWRATNLLWWKVCILEMRFREQVSHLHVYNRAWIHTGKALFFSFLCMAYFWKASRPSQPVINNVFTQLKLMATCWQITFISFYIFVFLSDTGKVI